MCLFVHGANVRADIAIIDDHCHTTGTGSVQKIFILVSLRIAEQGKTCDANTELTG